MTTACMEWSVERQRLDYRRGPYGEIEVSHCVISHDDEQCLETVESLSK